MAIPANGPFSICKQTEIDPFIRYVFDDFLEHGQLAGTARALWFPCKLFCDNMRILIRKNHVFLTVKTTLYARLAVCRKNSLLCYAVYLLVIKASMVTPTGMLQLLARIVPVCLAKICTTRSAVSSACAVKKTSAAFFASAKGICRQSVNIAQMH